jgi:seryl-tRNA synthetase
MARIGKKAPAATAAPKASEKKPAATAAAGMTIDKLGAGLKKVLGLLEELKAEQAEIKESIAALAEGLESLQEEDVPGACADEEDGEEAGEGDEEITADDIRQMKKADIIQLIEDNEIPIDPAEYPKVSELRNAVIALMESDDDEDGDEDGEEAGGGDGEDW